MYHPELNSQLLQLINVTRRQAEAQENLAASIEKQTMAIHALAASNEALVNTVMEMLDSAPEAPPDDEVKPPRVGQSFDDLDEPQTL